MSASAVERAVTLVDLGVSCLVVDTAHGHQRRMLEVLAKIREATQGRVPIVAGNVCTAEELVR
ncbi:MAG: IMP dehydrogenase [Polyangiales bacterium]